MNFIEKHGNKIAAAMFTAAVLPAGYSILALESDGLLPVPGSSEPATASAARELNSETYYFTPPETKKEKATTKEEKPAEKAAQEENQKEKAEEPKAEEKTEEVQDPQPASDLPPESPALEPEVPVIQDPVYQDPYVPAPEVNPEVQQPAYTDPSWYGDYNQVPEWNYSPANPGTEFTTQPGDLPAYSDPAWEGGSDDVLDGTEFTTTFMTGGNGFEGLVHDTDATELPAATAPEEFVTQTGTNPALNHSLPAVPTAYTSDVQPNVTTTPTPTQPVDAEPVEIPSTEAAQAVLQGADLVLQPEVQMDPISQPVIAPDQQTQVKTAEVPQAQTLNVQPASVNPNNALSHEQAKLNADIANAAQQLVGVTDGWQCTEVAAKALQMAGIDAINCDPDEFAQYGTITQNPVAGNLVIYDYDDKQVDFDHVAVFLGAGQAVHGNYHGSDGISRTVIAGVESHYGGTTTFVQVTPPVAV